MSGKRPDLRNQKNVLDEMKRHGDKLIQGGPAEWDSSSRRESGPLYRLRNLPFAESLSWIPGAARLSSLKRGLFHDNCLRELFYFRAENYQPNRSLLEALRAGRAGESNDG